MPISPLSASARSALLLCVLLVLAGCRKPRPAAPVPVPDAGARMEVALPGTEPERAAALRRALDAAVCLVRKGSADKCRDEEPEFCDLRGPEQVQALADSIRPALELAGALDMASAFTVDSAIARRLPGARRAGVLVDARRAKPCSDWGVGACAVFGWAGLWFQLGGPPGTGSRRADRVEIFLAGPPCAGDVRARRS